MSKKEKRNGFGGIIQKCIFILLLLVSVCAVNRNLGNADKRTYQAWSGFYSERNNSLDAVYIGASNVYPFWAAPVAWHDTGNAVYPLSLPGLPARAIKYVMEEARKTQPDALYILSLNDFKDMNYSVPQMHDTADYMKVSGTKYRMIKDLSAHASSEADPLEFAFPFVRYHSRWSELSTYDYVYTNSGLKAASTYRLFLANSNKVTDNYTETEQTVVLNPEQQEVLDDLVDYIREESVHVLFVIAPQAIKNESTVAQLNMIVKILEDSGYDVLNLQSSADEIGLSRLIDYYNENHLNVHGCLKFTRYMERYLQERYHFTDKRGMAGYEDWDQSYDLYREVIDPFTLDFERADAERDYSLLSPPIVSVDKDAQGNLVKWTPVANAKYYDIYRRTRDVSTDTYMPWEKAGSAEGNADQYLDTENVLPDTEYWYTVVPVREEGGTILYGHFNYTGKKVMTGQMAPRNVSLRSENDVPVIYWDPSDTADGYAVYRKLNGQQWCRIAEFAAEDSDCVYYDYYTEPGLPYLYSVGTYTYRNYTTTYGGYDQKGLLWNPQGLQAPVLSGQMMEDGNRDILWEDIKGADYYNVYRMDDTGKWKLIKGEIGPSVQRCIDRQVSETAGEYTYRVSAVLKYGDEEMEYYSQPLIITEEDK